MLYSRCLYVIDLHMQSFVVPDEVRSVYSSRSGGSNFEEWVTLFGAYSSAHPYLAGEFGRRMKGELPVGWKDALPRFDTVRDSDIICRPCSVLFKQLTVTACRKTKLLGPEITRNWC